MDSKEFNKKSLELAHKLTKICEEYDDSITINTCLSIVFSAFASKNSKDPIYRDEYNEHMISEWIAMKMNSYKKAMELLRSNGIDEYMKKHGGGYES